MAEKLNQLVADVKVDNLINSAYDTNACHVTVVAGQGKLSRGTALAANADGKAVILGTASATASWILAKDVDATEEVVAVAYREGHFNADQLIVKADYTITAKDKDDFRTRNIILSESL
jgi:hypothetical protein